MKTDNAYRFLGLIYRAGKVVWGYQAVMKALSKGNIILLIVAGDCSPRLKNKLLAICRQCGSQAVVYGHQVELGTALVNPPCDVVGITDYELARVIRQKLQEVDV